MSSHNFWNPVHTTASQMKMMKQQSRTLSVGSEDGECSVPPRMTMASQSSSFADDDVEGGHISSSDEEDEIIQTKFRPSRGGFMRRSSQTLGLTSRCRARSEPAVAEQTSSSKYHRRSAIFADSPYEPAVAKTGKRRWSDQSSQGSNELPRTISFNVDCKSGRKSHFFTSVVLPAFGLLAIFSVIAYQYNQISRLQGELDLSHGHRSVLTDSHSNLTRDLQKKQEHIENFRHTHGQLTKVHSDLSANMKKMRDEYAEGMKELSRLRTVERRVTWSEKRWNEMVDGIQERSRQSVLAKYGEGPHHVELTLELPHNETPQRVLIELAPLSMMPHSISTFLDQVSGGELDGTHFDLHAGHVLMGRSHIKQRDGDQRNDGSEHDVPRNVFPEYNSQFPHDHYTVTFPPASTASQKTGVEFYINLLNNAAHHSPRVEKDKDGNDRYVEGESAFGKIIDAESRKVVDAMDALQVVGGGLLEESVEIVSAKIISERKIE